MKQFVIESVANVLFLGLGCRVSKVLHRVMVKGVQKRTVVWLLIRRWRRRRDY